MHNHLNMLLIYNLYQQKHFNYAINKNNIFMGNIINLCCKKYKNLNYLLNLFKSIFISSYFESF